ncbi:hypothetical protein ALC53_11800 [Atta colombica]|uniref:C2H2-type domain-containing protein n=1 Tax=Atta colombica TaxID=520822 RepID=A0A195B0R0_9HYME|nr:hypothetical protein ALC53_11800 [Atta colombica]
MRTGGLGGQGRTLITVIRLTAALRPAIDCGRKLKCPFCERLYGYETNLRAHVRQRHQGIRVPCPYCARTFTRNNTVRRHIAREHKAELSMKQEFQQSNHSVSDTVLSNISDTVLQ